MTRQAAIAVTRATKKSPAAKLCVASRSQPTAIGPMTPPRFPTELMSAMPAAAPLRLRNVDGRDQKVAPERLEEERHQGGRQQHPPAGTDPANSGHAYRGDHEHGAAQQPLVRCAVTDKAGGQHASHTDNGGDRGDEAGGEYGEADAFDDLRQEIGHAVADGARADID